MKKKKILVVDDELIGRQLLQALLIIEGYEPIIAENGKEALELADYIQPDLILLDIMMPNLNGFEVTRKFKNNSKFKHIPIILITALDDSSSISKGKKAGASEYITKPYDKTEVIDILNRYLTK